MLRVEHQITSYEVAETLVILVPTFSTHVLVVVQDDYCPV